MVIPRKKQPARDRPFLETLTERQRRQLVDLGKHVDHPAGANLVNQADPAPPVFVLLSGYVKVLRTAQGDSLPRIVDLLGAGDVLGIEDCLAGRTSHLAYVATKAVRAFEIPQKPFRGFLDEHKQAMGVVAENLATRVRLRDIELGFTTAKVHGRLTALLARLQAVYGVRGKDGVVIDIGLNHSDIASAIGASPASVNSEIVKLKNDGYITIGYRTIHVKKQLREDAPSPFETGLPVRRLPHMRLGPPEQAESVPVG
jgi:CRP-like cAMP-binding protein